MILLYQKAKMKRQKRHWHENANNLLKERQKVFNGFESKIFPIKRPTCGTGLKIWSPKLMLQRLPIALPQVKTVNTSENLLNEIREVIYSLYQAKEITKKVHNNEFNTNIIQKMDTIFMNSKNSTTSDPDRLYFIF